MIRVLFVCLGNICRSPMAEAVFNDLAKRSNLQDKVEADSAGCGDWHSGQPAHKGTRAILEEKGIEYSGTARQLTRDDLEKFDYIITMDDENLAAVRDMKIKAGSTRAIVVPLLEFAASAKKAGVREVPDPYYGGGFEIVYRMIYDGCSGLLNEIRRAHEL